MPAISQRQSDDRLSPLDQAGVVDAVREAYETGQAILPVGGGTALDFGYEPAQPVTRLELAGLSKIVDYTPRDMTIVVEAGVRMHDLMMTLSGEDQHLPIDVPRAHEATIGGAVATNWSGSRRLGHGTIRDYVIGINAVDGRGVAFKGGGRVVKNVAGYDFCKLLTGSLGTLGVITQVALKVKPQLSHAATIVARCADLATAGELLDRLGAIPATFAAVDLFVGELWVNAFPNSDSAHKIFIAVRIEGSEPEVAWLVEQTQNELRQGGGHLVQQLTNADADRLQSRQVEFSDRGAGDADDDAQLVLKIAVPPTALMGIAAQLLKHDSTCTIHGYAGSGVAIARFAKFAAADLTRVLVGELRPAVVRSGGSLVVVRSKLDGLTSHIIWGGRTDAVVLLERIKRQFDPRKILNPGRFAYD
jgi:glycolate dehydrogenase FAD-binding subunit